MAEIFITGISGLIGAALDERLRADGHSITGSARPENRAKVQQRMPDARIVGHTLGDPIDVSGAGAVIHCAHDFTKGHRRQNVEGTQRIVEGSGKAHHVFLSSYSAHGGAKSEYGAVKLELERWFLARGQTIVRAGLVIGPGGLFLRLRRSIERSPVLPMLDGGRKRVAVIAIADLCGAISAIVAGGERGAFNLANAGLVTMAEIVEAIERAADKHPFHVPIPAKWLLFPLAIAETLRLPLPVTRENVKGYIANDAGGFASDLLRFVPAPQTLAQMIESSDAARR
ncbi:MAG: NAD-dependent epimerase/dehydratase family protein [Deltaproteobacteria bacterium]|nr:NAD-dependent epimerase/dehydratase family protein [Deltaproteobacteria bacterium]